MIKIGLLVLNKNIKQFFSGITKVLFRARILNAINIFLNFWKCLRELGLNFLNEVLKHGHQEYVVWENLHLNVRNALPNKVWKRNERNENELRAQESRLKRSQRLHE